jgi:hypothetical protein
MIHEEEFPMILWEEVCNRIVYVNNNNPHRILGGKYSGGGIFRSESINRIFEHISLSNLHACSCGEEDETGSLLTKGYIFGVQKDLKSLHDIHSNIKKDACE